VAKLASNPNNIIFAGVRNIELEAGHPLAQLVAEKPQVQLIKITSANQTDNLAAAQVIKEKFGKVDVIIAYAGMRPFTFEPRCSLTI
jgi:short-subunit dehydrogenase involved in D-alanine esterification of teichoic acids